MATEPESERVYKIALFGVTGCGKSSIINLIVDTPVAEVTEGVEACTKRARWYPMSLGEKKFRLWDTMGFNQAEARDVDPLSPYEQAHALLSNLQDGVDLILLCARKDGINASLHGLYWLLDNLFFRGEAQIALVLTHFDTPDDKWWDRNRNVIAKRCDMPAVQFPPHIGITAVSNGSSQSDPFYNDSRKALRALLEDYAVTPTPVRLDLSGDAARDAGIEGLKAHCQLSNFEATELLRRFSAPRRPFHAILFGEAGAGKSSVINLVAGKRVANVSDGIQSCTMKYESYRINTGRHQFLVWDTVGFNAYIEHSACRQAIENAVQLVRELHEKGGVDLLVFCKRSGRLSESEAKTFRLFREFLCEGQIPVAFIITNLETKQPMEKWWEENGKELLRACDLRTDAVAGHACITALVSEDTDDQRQPLKLSLSRKLVHAMLEDSISYGSAPTEDVGIRVMSFLKKLVSMVRVGQPSRKARITPQSLVKRCGLSERHAEELVKMLYG